MISLDYQNLDIFDYHALERAIEEGVSTASPLVDEFETVMADYLGVEPKNVLATNSGTAALHLALIGCGIRPSDEVVVPILTFVSTVNVIKYMGAFPVFSDVDPNTWLYDNNTEGNARPCRAIIPVDLYGNVWERRLIYNGKIVLDSAESLGARKNNTGNFMCFSFNGNKIVTTGGGGLLVGDDLDELKKLSIQAKLPDGGHFDVGYNYRMTGLSAALGLSQIKKMNHFLERKKKINQIYRAELSNFLQFQEGNKSSWWFTAALWPATFNIVKVQNELMGEGVPTRRIFRPLNQSRIFCDYKRYPIAEYIYEHGLCLPSSTLMTDEDIYQVCKIVKEVCFD